MDKFCENCGYKLNANDKFCEKCGSKIEEKDKPKKATLIENNMGENINNNGSNTLFCIIGIIVVIIIIFGVISLFTGGGTTVKGVSFNIPEGYKPDDKVASVWEKYDFPNSEVKGYSNADGEFIGLLVADVPSGKTINDIHDNSKKVSINGKDVSVQYYSSGQRLYKYVENGKLVCIFTSDKSIIKEIIC